MDGRIHEAMKFERHMGVNIIRPTDPSYPKYIVIFRFNTYENLTKWERSEIRKEWLVKVRGGGDSEDGEDTFPFVSGKEIVSSY
jgi:antibiotic biosynthesis monooxygenase (ABM) superfamily enzyme